MDNIKLAIVGSRGFDNYDLLKAHIDALSEVFDITEIVSGGAKGADKLGAKWARENNVPLVEFIPEWNKYGRSAGYKRNVDIVNRCTHLIAFWDGSSRGTMHSINIAKEQGKPAKTVRYSA